MDNDKVLNFYLVPFAKNLVLFSLLAHDQNVNEI